jgi:NADH-quinone oxidoreductase subunit D
VIRHFGLVMEGFKPPAGEVYHAVESPRGELGFYIVSDGGSRPLRLKVRPPSFVNLQGLVKMVRGRLLADVVATSGRGHRAGRGGPIKKATGNRLKAKG